MSMDAVMFSKWGLKHTGAASASRTSCTARGRPREITVSTRHVRSCRESVFARSRSADVSLHRLVHLNDRRGLGLCNWVEVAPHEALDGAVREPRDHVDDRQRLAQECVALEVVVQFGVEVFV